MNIFSFPENLSFEVLDCWEEQKSLLQLPGFLVSPSQDSPDSWESWCKVCKGQRTHDNNSPFSARKSLYFQLPAYRFSAPGTPGTDGTFGHLNMIIPKFSSAEDMVTKQLNVVTLSLAMH